MTNKMEAKKNQVNFYENAYCEDCGYPILFACCNFPFSDFKNAKESDYWVYCSNKCCKNHEGEGIWQDIPDWISVLENEQNDVVKCAKCGDVHYKKERKRSVVLGISPLGLQENCLDTFNCPKCESGVVFDLRNLQKR